jgi:VanZ family protein
VNTERGNIANRRGWKVFLRNWAPVAFWAVIIFSLSSDGFSSSNTAGFLEPLLSAFYSGITAAQFELIHLLIRKLSHWGEYCILSLLLLRAVRDQLNQKLALRRALWIAAAVAVYALSDEFHQLFVPSRTASLADVTIDSFGGFCGILWSYLNTQRNRPAPDETPGGCNTYAACKKT